MSLTAFPAMAGDTSIIERSNAATAMAAVAGIRPGRETSCGNRMAPDLARPYDAPLPARRKGGEPVKALRISIAAGVCVVLLLSGLSAPAQEQPPGNIVTEWNLIAVNTLVT